MNFVAVWAWIKKYWQVLVGLLVALIGFLMGVQIRRRPVVITGEDPERKKIEDKTKAAEAEAEKVREQERQDAQAAHDAEIQGVVIEEQRTTEQIKGDADAVVDYLHQVGDDVRKDSR